MTHRDADDGLPGSVGGGDVPDIAEPDGEWREGWGFYRGFRCAWTSWGLGIDISLGVGNRHNREWGIYISLGPLFAYATFEHEMQFIEIDGRPSSLAVGLFL